MQHIALIRHPATHCAAVTGIDVRIGYQPGRELTLTYTLCGRIAGLLLPGEARPARVDELWRHTCFEAFVQADDGPGYREFNFSPSGEWAAYHFRSYRDGDGRPGLPAPDIDCRVCEVALELEVRLAPAALPDARRLRLGLAAVVEADDGTLSYWALRHPLGKPDFHHTDGFTLDLGLT
jgi:hypothetical protein